MRRTQTNICELMRALTLDIDYGKVAVFMEIRTKKVRTNAFPEKNPNSCDTQYVIVS